MSAGVLYILFRGPPAPVRAMDDTAPLDSAEPTAGPAVLRPRCKPHGSAAGFRIAGRPRQANFGASDLQVPDGAAAFDEPPELDVLAPFAPEVGRAAYFPGGFAVGIKREEKGDGSSVSVAEVAVIDEHAKEGRLLRLARTRGDVDAPLIGRRGDSWVAAFLEPNASGFSLRLAVPDGDGLRWGAELSQGRDESLAYDVAFGEQLGVVVWDDVTKGGRRAHIVLATVTTQSLEGGERAKSVSRAAIDAELPRVVPRAGGFWLAYVARHQKPPEDSDRPDGQYAAERIDSSWIELAPLDQYGKLVAEPTPVTAKDGQVLSYDLQLGDADSATLVWRDDDTPMGAHGGTVFTMRVDASGGRQTQVAVEDDVGAGAPDLLGGWLSLTNKRGEMTLGPLSPAAELLAPVRVEPLAAAGRLLASHGAVLLVARPTADHIDLVTIECSREQALSEAPAVIDAGVTGPLKQDRPD